MVYHHENINHEIAKDVAIVLPSWIVEFLPKGRLEKFRMRNIRNEYNFLMRSQWWKLKDLERFQTKKLKAYVWYAYHNIPFYRRAFRKEGISPYNINSLKDLTKIPIINKNIVRKNFHSIVSDSCTFYRIFSTSGSTGKPFLCPVSKEAVNMRDGLWQRFFSWTGCNPATDSMMGILRPVSVYGASMNPKGLILRNLRFLFLRQIHWTPKILSVDEIIKIFYIMKKFNPKLVQTIPNALISMLKVRDEYGIEFPESLEIISLGGEPVNIEYFKKAVDVEIFMRYGANDIGQFIANECEQRSGLHVNMEDNIVEVIKDNESVDENETGEITITDLHNYDFPLIRYNIEDVGNYESGRCSCGRSHPRLENILGRKTDLLVSKKGGITANVEWKFQELRGIEHFRIIQKKIDKITVLIVPSKEYSEDTDREVLRILKDFLGNEIDVKIKIVKKIPHGLKYRFIISEVSEKYFRGKIR